MFPLFQFTILNSDNTYWRSVVTRGRNVNEALTYIKRNYPRSNIRIDSSCFINAAKIYSQNHRFDWLNTPMYWLTH